MADLSFANLQAVTGVEAGTFTVVNGDVVISVSKLVGQAVDTLDNQAVTDFAYKLLLYARAAQNAYNTGKVAGERINSFSDITFGQTSLRQGGLYATATATLTAALPVDLGGTTALLN